MNDVCILEIGHVGPHIWGATRKLPWGIRCHSSVQSEINSQQNHRRSAQREANRAADRAAMRAARRALDVTVHNPPGSVRLHHPLGPSFVLE